MKRSEKQPRDVILISARKIDKKRRGVFAYFHNDAKVSAPFDAIRLARRLR